MILIGNTDIEQGRKIVKWGGAGWKENTIGIELEPSA